MRDLLHCLLTDDIGHNLHYLEELSRAKAAEKVYVQQGEVEDIDSLRRNIILAGQNINAWNGIDIENEIQEMDEKIEAVEEKIYN